jgi:hypothetical protein
MLLRTTRVLALSAAILLAAVTATEAKDLCINPNIRLSRFRQPARGQCLPVAGTRYDGSGHFARASGTVCTRSDGTQLYVGLTVFYNVDLITDTTPPNFYSINIDVPALSYTYDRKEPAGDLDSGSGQAAYCSGVTIP